MCGRVDGWTVGESKKDKVPYNRRCSRRRATKIDRPLPAAGQASSWNGGRRDVQSKSRFAEPRSEVRHPDRERNARRKESITSGSAVQQQVCQIPFRHNSIPRLTSCPFPVSFLRQHPLGALGLTLSPPCRTLPTPSTQPLPSRPLALPSSKHPERGPSRRIPHPHP